MFFQFGTKNSFKDTKKLWLITPLLLSLFSLNVAQREFSTKRLSYSHEYCYNIHVTVQTFNSKWLVDFQSVPMGEKSSTIARTANVVLSVKLGKGGSAVTGADIEKRTQFEKKSGWHSWPLAWTASLTGRYFRWRLQFNINHWGGGVRIKEKSQH